MSGLQKVALGTPPTAVDGDTVRGANIKMNSNVDVLNTQTVLTSNAAVITAAQALTVAHVGKRVNINLAAAGTINLPAASTCTADSVIHLRNVGATLVTLAITSGSGDTIALTTLAAGESAIMDTDGVHAWTCAIRGRSNTANELMRGASTINTAPAVIGSGLTTAYAVVGLVNFLGPAAGSAGVAIFTGIITFTNGANTSAIADALAYVDIYDVPSNALVTAGPAAIRTIQSNSVFNDVNMTVGVAASGLTPGRTYQVRINAKITASVGVATTVSGLGITGVSF